MHPTLTIVDLGDRSYRLERPAGNTIGWMRGHAVGLLGLRGIPEALTHVPALRRVLDRMLAEHYPDRYRPIRDVQDLRVVHDGAYEWIAAGNAPLARLHRPRPDRPGDSLSVEFVLPSYADEQVTRAAASVLAHAVQEVQHAIAA